MSLTKDQLFALIGANVPDNTSGLITPTGMREVLTQTADSMLFAAKGIREVELLRAASTATQAPTAVDTPLQLTFGAAQLSATDPVMLNSAGVVTFNSAGAYAVRIKLQNGRTGATGTSILLSRLLINGAQVGSTAAVKMTQTDATTPTESRVVVQASAGQTFTVQIMRDSSGSNFGGVYPQVATVSAWGTAPSALLVISRLEPVP
ncbi:hypothetical protein OTAKU_00140 [Serratia phage vB_SmaM-Otaku]|uniref:Neck protein n=1 Tax=Serratia phage vB_SmaM-Otaku TaxID=2932867 RepID=A0AAE9KS07_9CAUD|nr:hypothetical protein PF631_gp14 [Serratia phage vB_SmaM-Otaku]UPU16003.1 hypothetical protein OTAKU_00140 [Serratia phage vB_SmaM-Otaku]